MLIRNKCGVSRPGDAARSIIAERWPDLARHLASLPKFSTLELDTSGPVQTLSADGIRLASAWDPDAEGLLQISHLPASSHNITLYGVGMGGLPKLLLQRLSSGGTLTVVLMNASLFDTILDVIEQTDWLLHPSIKLELASEQTNVAHCRAITTPLLRLAEESAERLRDHLYQALTHDRTQRHHSRQNTLLTSNITANEDTLISDPDVATLFGSHRGAVVVVGAGPSLDLTLSRVKSIQAEGAQVICVDAAVLPMKLAGIIPDYIVTLDASPLVMRFFEIDFANLKRTSLVYFPTVDPNVVKHWIYDRYVAYTTHRRYKSLRKRISHTSLFSSGSVIHPATDLAVRMGATTVYLAGADFGFPFNITHARSMVLCRPSPLTNASGLTVTCYGGDPVPTDMSFLSYYRDLEAYIGSGICQGCKFVNLGQFSARITGVSFELVT